MISEDTNPNCHYKVTVMRPSYQKRDLKSDATKPFFFFLLRSVAVVLNLKPAVSQTLSSCPVCVSLSVLAGETHQRLLRDSVMDASGKAKEAAKSLATAASVPQKPQQYV